MSYASGVPACAHIPARSLTGLVAACGPADPPGEFGAIFAKFSSPNQNSSTFGTSWPETQAYVDIGASSYHPAA
jgi:hypothetical protein